MKNNKFTPHERRRLLKMARKIIVNSGPIKGVLNRLVTAAELIDQKEVIKQ